MLFKLLKRLFCKNKQMRALHEIREMSELDLRDLSVGRSEIPALFLNEKNPGTDTHWGNRYPEV
ncbi:hypothetical protein ACO0LB_08790 [Undibacterium sp. SXout7W]|uniref:hypothetical protein n=1 Tax=Undibacterium sp. SXout7W TaxID=3413049 RepID=UPI003BF1C10B